jgi:hypothetical protein
MVLTLIFTDDTLLAQSVLVDVFPKNASLPLMLDVLKLLMLLTEMFGVDMFPAQSVLVDVFPKNALLPVALTVEMLLVTSPPAGIAPT